MSGHQRGYRGLTDTWLTPPEIVRALGPFDLDPCCPPSMPWRTAIRMIQWPEDGFVAEWTGKVWLNPPYGPETRRWLAKLADHGNGIALIFARTETAVFFESVWPRADAMLFLRGRLHFHRPSGERAKLNSGAPSVLIAYGPECASKLEASGIAGRFIRLASPASEVPDVA